MRHGFQRHTRRGGISRRGHRLSRSLRRNCEGQGQSADIGAVTTSPVRWRKPRPIRRKKPRPVLPALPGRRNGAGAAAPRCSRSSSRRKKRNTMSIRASSSSVSACACRHCAPGGQRSKSNATPCPRSEPTRSGASSFPNRPAVRTSPRSGHVRSADGDDWIINGQKIWTSGAHFSDFGVLVTRSDFDAPQARRD